MHTPKTSFLTCIEFLYSVKVHCKVGSVSSVSNSLPVCVCVGVCVSLVCVKCAVGADVGTECRSAGGAASAAAGETPGSSEGAGRQRRRLSGAGVC